MKTYLLVLFFSALFLSNLNAQSVHLGIKGGANINKLSGQPFSDKYTFGYHIGGFIELGIGNKLYIQPEVLFSQVKQDTSSQFRVTYNSILGSPQSKIQLNYINIPVLLGYKVSDILTIQAGPQYSILMSKNESLLQNGKNPLKSGDFSVLAGW
jgi:Outer membrane protein beta-barrel domain